MNKARGGDGIPVELFQILKDDAVKVLHSICHQIWKTQQWPQDWKRSVFIPIPKKGNAKYCWNYHTVALISHSSKEMWKILQELGIPDHLTCLLRNLYAGHEATFRTRNGTTDWFQMEKVVCQGSILLPCLFNFMQNTSCKMLGWMNHKLESRLLGEISITSDSQMTPPLWQKAKS